MMRFKNFLLNESKAYLSQRVGDLLTALQNLQEDAEGMSKRSLERALTRIVDQIRKILHGRWEDTDKPDLLLIQKVGVGIMAGMEESDSDLPSLVASAVSELENLTGDMEEPLNSLGSEESAVDVERGEMLDSGGDGELPEELDSD